MLTAKRSSDYTLYRVSVSHGGTGSRRTCHDVGDAGLVGSVGHQSNLGPRLAEPLANFRAGARVVVCCGRNDVVQSIMKHELNRCMWVVLLLTPSRLRVGSDLVQLARILSSASHVDNHTHLEHIQVHIHNLHTLLFVHAC